MGKHWTRLAFLAGISCLLPALRSAELPRQSPPFSFSLNDGKKIAVSDYRGKVVVLTFILTTCPHCQATTGFLSKIQTDLGARGLQVLECALEQSAAQNVPGFIKNFNPTFPVGYTTNSNDVLTYLQHPPSEIPYMPMVVFIDRGGVIRAQYSGKDVFITDEAKEAQNLRLKVEELLKTGSPAAKGTSKKKK
jgi:peroxiredoxin